LKDGQAEVRYMDVNKDFWMWFGDRPVRVVNTNLLLSHFMFLKRSKLCGKEFCEMHQILNSLGGDRLSKRI
jgi:hypothetical protein